MKFEEDHYYIQQIMTGDTSAYSFLVTKHKNLVFSIALKILNNREDAEEIAQDTFVKAYQSLKSFEQKSKFSTWLYRIAYNTAISKTRKKKLETTAIDDHLITNYSTDDIVANVDQLEENDQLRLIEQVMKYLPEDDQLLITLFYKAENSIEEISEITGLSQSNVKVRLHRIRKKMYDQIQKLIQRN